MSHSTNAGLSRRGPEVGVDSTPVVLRSWRPRVREFLLSSAAESRSRAFAVAHISPSRFRFAPCVEVASDPGLLPSWLFGVAQPLTFCASGVPAPLPLIPFAFSVKRLASKLSCVSVSFERCASAVGQDPEPLASMGRANIVRAEHTPLRIEPEFGQRPENGAEVFAGEKSKHVFQQRETWSYFTENSRRFRPEVALIRFAFALACAGEGLARESCGDDIDAPSPLGSIEHLDVAVDRELFQRAVALPRPEHALAVLVLLDRANSLPAEQLARED